MRMNGELVEAELVARRKAAAKGRFRTQKNEIRCRSGLLGNDRKETVAIGFHLPNALVKEALLADSIPKPRSQRRLKIIGKGK